MFIDFYFFGQKQEKYMYIFIFAILSIFSKNMTAEFRRIKT